VKWHQRGEIIKRKQSGGSIMALISGIGGKQSSGMKWHQRICGVKA